MRVARSSDGDGGRAPAPAVLFWTVCQLVSFAERLNQEIKRHTHVVRIFPNMESRLRLVRALAVETHENWLEGTRYLNMQHLAAHKKDARQSRWA
jgi:transposase-like protein